MSLWLKMAQLLNKEKISKNFVNLEKYTSNEKSKIRRVDYFLKSYPLTLISTPQLQLGQRTNLKM